MTKKEQEYTESILVKLALCFTERIEPDIDIPKSYDVVTNGYSFNEYGKRVEKSCSTCNMHSLNNWYKPTSKGAIKQFSTRVLALKAMRHKLEMRMAKELRDIDKMIETEQARQDAEPIDPNVG